MIGGWAGSKGETFRLGFSSFSGESQNHSLKKLLLAGFWQFRKKKGHWIKSCRIFLVPGSLALATRHLTPQKGLRSHGIRRLLISPKEENVSVKSPNAGTSSFCSC